MGTNVAQPTEQCRMTLKNGQRCRNRSKYNGLCGRHWRHLMSNRPTLTRREWLQITANVAQVIGTGILIRNQLGPTPPTSATEIRVGDKVTTADSASVTLVPFTASLSFTTSFSAVLVRPAAKASIAPRITVGAPIEARRALWQIRVHPKKLADVPAGRLLWNQLRFPYAPDRWAI